MTEHEPPLANEGIAKTNTSLRDASYLQQSGDLLSIA